ncbi:MAG: hypothetical protein WBP29_07890 [Candidatus Zixiibacteriota bacterium]
MPKVVISSEPEYTGGSESRLLSASKIVLIVSSLAAIASLIISGIVTRDSSYDDWAENGLNWTWVALGCGILLQGWIVHVLLAAGADVLRLLKKQNGLEFTGEINEVHQTEVYKCSDCGAVLGSNSLQCPGCKSKLEF